MVQQRACVRETLLKTCSPLPKQYFRHFFVIPQGSVFGAGDGCDTLLTGIYRHVTVINFLDRMLKSGQARTE